MSYDGVVNTSSVTQGYYSRLRKIQQWELLKKNSIPQCICCIRADSNIWETLLVVEEIHSKDNKSRKVLTPTEIFHRNGKIDRLYLKGEEGGWSLSLGQTAFEILIVSPRFDLQNSNKNK